MEQSQAYSSPSWGWGGRWSCWSWKSLREDIGYPSPPPTHTHTSCFFCPKAEFWRPVWVGRHSKPELGLLVKAPDSTCPYKRVTKSLTPERPAPSALESGTLLRRVQPAWGLALCVLCPVAPGTRERLLLVSCLLAFPGLILAAFAQVCGGRRELGDFEKPQIFSRDTPLTVCLFVG